MKVKRYQSPKHKKIAGWNAVARVITVLIAALHCSYGQTPDSAPPRLIGMSLTPAEVDVRNSSQDVTISLTLTDNLSGVTFGYPFLYEEFILRSPSGKQVIKITNSSSNSSFQLFSGTSLNGVWQQSVTIPAFSESGQWTVASLTVPDAAQNQLVLNTTELVQLGFPRLSVFYRTQIQRRQRSSVLR